MVFDHYGGEPEREGPAKLLKLLGTLAPAGVRRVARMERLAEEMGRAVASGAGRGLPDAGFDPNLGASGRPGATYEHPGGPRAAGPLVVKLSEVHYWDARLKWSGTGLTVSQAHQKARPISLPLAPTSDATATTSDGGRGSGAVAEVVLFVSRWAGRDSLRPEVDHDTSVRVGSLHFLDARGYAILVVPEVRCAWREIAAVSEAAGLPFRVYAFSCSGRAGEEMADLLFPRRRGSVRLGE